MSDLVKLLRGHINYSGIDGTIKEAAGRIEELEHMVKDINEYEDDMDKLQARVDELENPWVSVEDRLPDFRDGYLLTFDGSNVMACWYGMGKFFGEMESPTTHWMPLPKPPE